VAVAADTDGLATTQWEDNQSAEALGRSVALKALGMRSVAAAAEAAVTLAAVSVAGVSVAAEGDRWVQLEALTETEDNRPWCDACHSLYLVRADRTLVENVNNSLLKENNNNRMPREKRTYEHATVN